MEIAWLRERKSTKNGYVPCEGDGSCWVCAADDAYRERKSCVAFLPAQDN